MAARDGVSPPGCPSRSLFDLPPDFFDSCRLLSDPREIPAPQPNAPSPAPALFSPEPSAEDGHGVLKAAGGAGGGRAASGWTCHTCEMEFESLQDQRFHFKCDFHRLNVKLHVCGKGAIKEEDFDELGDESLSKEFDVSSISGSEDDSDSSLPSIKIPGQERELAKQKVYIRLQSGETVSLWRCLLLDDSEDLSFENNKPDSKEKVKCMPYASEYDPIKRLKYLAQESRDKTHLRIVLLACGGHFAGCVFDGNSIVAHKTFHRYVVRAKAGKKQSAKDATGKAANSAGSYLRRYNEAALKKEIHELLATWRPYFDSSSCIFIYAPSKNHQLLFDGDKQAFNPWDYVVRHIPMTVRRPTLKEVKRIYNLLTHLVYEANKDRHSTIPGDPALCAEEKGVSQEAREECPTRNLESSEMDSSGACLHPASSGLPRPVTDKEVEPSIVNEGTPLHEAAKSGDAQRTLELLEQGLDPCVKDVRGRTPYMLALEKEVRNTFRRFMALNLDKWDWHAANVPSPLTKEMEESQAAKQAEKDAKRKTKAKELKKLRKAKEKAKAQVAVHQNHGSIVSESEGERPATVVTRQAPTVGAPISPEEELKRALAAEREKRAAAAERRIAAVRASAADTAAPSASSSDSRGSTPTTTSQSGVGTGGSGNLCSCCHASLAGKVPFHRYHYKYCSTSCMHVHREMLEDG